MDIPSTIVEIAYCIIAVIMASSSVAFMIVIFRRPKPQEKKTTKEDTAFEYERFESDKDIWKQRIKATGALTAILVTLFCIWSLFMLYLEYQPNLDDSKIQGTITTTDETNASTFSVDLKIMAEETK